MFTSVWLLNLSPSLILEECLLLLLHCFFNLNKFCITGKCFTLHIKYTWGCLLMYDALEKLSPSNTYWHIWHEIWWHLNASCQIFDDVRLTVSSAMKTHSYLLPLFISYYPKLFDCSVVTSSIQLFPRSVRQYITLLQYKDLATLQKLLCLNYFCLLFGKTFRNAGKPIQLCYIDDMGHCIFIFNFMF